MDDPTPQDLDALTADPGRLDGHTLDELADYLDNDRTPYNAAIEQSPACRNALAALERLRAVSGDLLTDPAVADTGSDDAWIATVLSRIAADAHDGADFLLARTPDGDEVVMTEGALRALVRAAGDDQPGFLVGRVRFTGDLSDPRERITIALEVTVAHGVVIPDATTRLRAAIIAQVHRHTAIREPAIDITVRDLTIPEEDR